MAPKLRSGRKRQGARIRGPGSSPPPSQPRNQTTSMAIVPYQGPSSSSTAPASKASSLVSGPVSRAKRNHTPSVSAPKGQEAIEWLEVTEEGRDSPSPKVVSDSQSKRATRSSSKGSFSANKGGTSKTSSPGTNSPPSKRQKGSPSSKQVHVYKSLNSTELLDLVCVPQIVQERSFCVDELGGLFQQAVLRQGWEVCLERMASVRLNLSLVKDFYASLAAAFGPSHKAETLKSKPVTIRGKTVIVSPLSIGYALGLPVATKVDKERVDSDLKLMTKEHVVKCCYSHPPSKLPTELSCGQLHVSHRALGHLVRALLYPTTQTSQLPLTEAKLVCYIATENKKLPAEFFLFESLRKIAVSIARGKIGPKSSLFHPAVISIFCQQQGIDFCEGDELGEPIKLSMSSVIRGNAQSLTPGLSLDVEAAINMARKNAASSEDRMDRRLAAIEGSVIGLQKVIGKLVDALVTANVIPPIEATEEDPPCQS